MKLKSVLKESRIKLSKLENYQIDELLPKIVKVIKGPELGKDESVYVGSITYIYSGYSRSAVARVYVKNGRSNSDAYFQRAEDVIDKSEIVIQQTPFKRRYFQGNTGEKIVGKLIGKNAEAIGLTDLRDTLVHELVHAKDPSGNVFHAKPEADFNKDPLGYFGNKSELEAMSSAVYNFIETEVDKVLDISDNVKDLRKLLNILKDILLVFSGKSKKFENETYDFFNRSHNRNFIQKAFAHIQKLNTFFKVQPNLQTHTEFLSQIKKANQQNYKHYLKNLYKVVVECKEKIEEKIEWINKDMLNKDGSLKFDLD